MKSACEEEDPAKQVEMLRDAFLATGKSLENMTKFEKMAAAEAMFKDSKDQARSLSIQSDGLAAHMAKTVKAFDQA